MVTIHKKKVESAEEKEARLQKEKETSMGLQDEYQAKGFELVSWVQDNKGAVSVAIAAVLLTCVAFSGYLFYQKRAATLASITYLEVMQALEDAEEKVADKDKHLQQAQDSLKSLALSSRGSNISVLANVYAAHLALEKDDAKEAVALYENALSKIKNSDDLFPLVKVGLGLAYKSDGQKEKALASFKELIATKDISSKELALFEAAQLLKENNDLDQASEYLARLLDEYPSSVYNEEAKRLKKTLE